MPIYERGIGRRRRRYLAYLLGWIPVTVLWSVGTVDLPEAVQHFLWPVFICLSARALRALAKFRAIVDVWRSSAVSLLYVAGYVAGWILIGGEASGATALASRITLGAVLSASAGFLTALVSISVPSRIESAVVEGLPEGLPDDWKDSAAEELSTLRDSTRPPK
jgi:hypothetical protein